MKFVYSLGHVGNSLRGEEAHNLLDFSRSRECDRRKKFRRNPVVIFAEQTVSIALSGLMNKRDHYPFVAGDNYIIVVLYLNTVSAIR